MSSFKIFTPVQKFYFTSNTIIWLLLITAFLPCVIEIGVLQHNEYSLFSIVFIAMGFMALVLGMIYFAATGNERHKPLKGIIAGDIIFDNEYVAVNQIKYQMSAIKKINFSPFNDYKGRVESYSKHNYNGRISHGVGNRILITLNSGKTIKINFELVNRYQIRDFRPQLVHYHNEGKLHFLNLIDILGIEDYNAIQIFKKSLPDGGDIKSY